MAHNGNKFLEAGAVAAAVLFGALLLLGLEFVRPASAGRRPKAEPAKEGPGKPGAPAPAGAEEQPEDGKLYVWPVPEVGLQSLLVLQVQDGGLVDAAFLVPVQLKLKGAAKASKAAVEKLLAAGILPARLEGRDASGRVVADFWLSKKEGWTSRKLSP